MLKYKILSNNVIEVDLENDYKVIAMANWNKENKKYYITLYIHEESTDIWDLMEKAENIEIESDIKSIKRDMAQYATKLLTEGFFKYYIDRYEHMMKCFDKGNELFEKEESKKNSKDNGVN